jgi:hypothetical protein
MTPTPQPPPQPWRARAVDAVIGGTTSMAREQDALVLRHSPGNGCAGIFVVCWLLGWGTGVVYMARETVKTPELRAILVLLLVAGVWLVIAGNGLFNSFARDELRVDNRRIKYRRVVIVTLRRWEAALFDVTGVDVINASSRRSSAQPALAIRLAGGGQRLFGSGATDEILARWAVAVREHIGHATGRHLAVSEQASQILADDAERHRRIVRDALDSVGVRDESELKDRPELQHKAIEHTRESALAESMARYGPKRDQRGKSKLLGCAAEIVYTIFGVGWVGATLGATVKLVIERKWTMIPMLIALWGIGLILGFIALVIISVNFKKLWTGIGKLWR